MTDINSSRNNTRQSNQPSIGVARNPVATQSNAIHNAMDEVPNRNNQLNMSFNNQNTSIGQLQLNQGLQELINNNPELALMQEQTVPNFAEGMKFDFGDLNPNCLLSTEKVNMFAAVNIFKERFMKEINQKYCYSILDSKDRHFPTKGEEVLQKYVLYHLMEQTYLGVIEKNDADGARASEFVNTAEEMHIMKNDINKLVVCINEIHQNLVVLREENNELRKYVDINLLEFSEKTVAPLSSNDKAETVKKNLEKNADKKDEELANKFDLYEITTLPNDSTLYNDLSSHQIKTKDGLIINKKYIYNINDGKIRLTEASPFNSKIFKGEVASFDKLSKEGCKIFRLTQTLNVDKDINDILHLRVMLKRCMINKKRKNLIPQEANYYYLHIIENQIVLEAVKKEEISKDYVVEYKNKLDEFAFVTYDNRSQAFEQENYEEKTRNREIRTKFNKKNNINLKKENNFKGKPDYKPNIRKDYGYYNNNFYNGYSDYKPFVNYKNYNKGKYYNHNRNYNISNRNNYYSYDYNRSSNNYYDRYYNYRFNNTRPYFNRYIKYNDFDNGYKYKYNNKTANEDSNKDVNMDNCQTNIVNNLGDVIRTNGTKPFFLRKH